MYLQTRLRTITHPFAQPFLPRLTVARAAANMPVQPATPLEDIPTPDEVAPLFEPIKIGAYELKTRAVYAPLTRCRALGTVPVEQSAQYYAERTNRGQLVLSEGTLVSKDGHGYPNTPGIYTQEQIDAWKPIVKAVHNKQGVFFCQIWHCGRASHSAYHDGELPVSASAVPIGEDYKAFHPATFQELTYESPRALALEEIPKYVDYFRQAARNAVDAGFDGVEIHGTNGYLIDQFLQDACNKRDDAYGGSFENRCRFCLEVVKAVTDEIGAEKVGIRLGPFTGFLSIDDSDKYGLFEYLVKQLNPFKLAYLHFVTPRVIGNMDKEDEVTDTLKPFTSISESPVILAGGFKRDDSAAAIKAGDGDMVAFGRWALANPDLLKRFKLNAPLNKYDRNTFYMPGMEGYIDYPFLENTDYGKDFFQSATEA